MQYTLFAQLMACDPRKMVRFPDVPLDNALASLQELTATIEKLQAVPAPAPVASTPPIGSMPPVVPAAAEPAPADPKAAANAALEVYGGSIAGLATQVWRARNRVIDPATGEPREEMRRVHRHVEGACEALSQIGVVMKDWVNQPYDAGLPVKVLTFQPTAEVQRDTILEAVRPTVIWNDQILQMGEVIVAVPQTSEEKPQ